MFASNEKISVRQIKRLVLFDIFGISSLILPQLLAKNSSADGAFAILAGMFLGMLFLWLLRKVLSDMKTDYYAYLKSAFGRIGSDLCCIFYFFYSISLSGFAAYEICMLMKKNLLREQSFLLVLTVLLLVGAYGVYGGIESRGRVYEILFPVLALILIVMLALCASNVKADRIAPLFYSDGAAFLKSTYLAFGFFSLLFFLLFLKPYCSKEKNLAKAMTGVAAILGIVLFFIYVILVGVFGSASLAELRMAIVTLMSMVEIPGGFLERLDAVMVGVWFFTLYALMDNTIFYSVDILRNTFRISKKRYPALITLFLVYAVAAQCQNSMFFLNLLKQLFYYVATPLVVLIPFAAYLVEKKKGSCQGMRKEKVSVLLIAVMLLLCGCGNHELENRSFPLALGIEKEKEDCRMVFNFPVLSDIADENADGNYMSMDFVQGKDFFLMEHNYEKNASKAIDFSHCKVMVLGESFLKDQEKTDALVSYLENQQRIARNTYLFVTQLPLEELFAMDKDMEKPLGTYLEELLESDESLKNKEIVTLGKYMDERKNQSETLYIPVIGEVNKMPSVTAAYVVYHGEVLGEVSVEMEMCGNFIQGDLEKYFYEDTKGNQWEITDIKPTYRISSEGEHTRVSVEITCDAILKNAEMKDWREQENKREQLKAELETKLGKSRKEAAALGYDITDSYKKTANHARKIYRKYEGNSDGYLKSQRVSIVIEPSVLE